MRTMIPAERFLTASLRAAPHGARVTRILSAALEAADPAAAVGRAVSLEGNRMRVASREYKIRKGGRILAVALGKAAAPMADALAKILGGRLSAGLVITKHAPAISPFPIHHSQFTIIEGGHPVPDERSLEAGRRIMEMLSGLTADDLVICLISGGGSALATAPVDGVTLAELQSLTSALLACGAGIDEINTLRRHLDVLKGGGLARLARPARVVSLILSDVVGSPFEAVASGPTAPDPTTCADALAVLEKYHFCSDDFSRPSQKATEVATTSVLDVLKSGTETLKPGDPIFAHVQNLLVGENLLAAQAALKQAEVEGFHPYLLRADLRGEAREAAVDLCRTLRWARQTDQPAHRPACIVVGGETTVTLCQNPGRGGRNTELALAAVTELADFPDVMLVTLATDGEDGTTDAAGAVVTGETYKCARLLGLEPADYLRRNDSYSFFAALDDLLQPGPTGTNVNDLVFLFAF
ncbi:MAG: hydroxypyruvate reductase [Anaerolineaceae bacterium]|nr:MAG: hydroxypyruvate reductase [Anaerolineaceae bacterium]